MINKNVLAVYEDYRSIIWKLENVRQKLDKLPPKIKTKVSEALDTTQSDLLNIANLLLDVTNCETDSDLEFLLDLQVA
ncbi:MAG: hypothetical protein FD122_2675 [Stygiobacter sp.]|nr:MAG: hypothetical protein FD122_2675 [Stygiobacter sp.]KAF0215210.1 MAG: hypothetical protein FD178_1849 [Ignavibacteria bacterium]